MGRLSEISLRTVLAGCACTGALALTSAPALADANDPDYPGSELQVSIQPPADPTTDSFNTVMTGTNAEQFDVFGNPGTEQYTVTAYFVLPGIGPLPCPKDNEDEFFNAMDPFGTYYVNPPMDVGLYGPFTLSVPTAVPAGYSGPIVICAYMNYYNDDAAFATTMTNVVANGSGPPQLGIAPSGGGSQPTGTTPTGSPPAGGKAPSVALRKPAVVLRPKVSRRGRELVCQTGTWQGRPKSFSYRWRVAKENVVIGRKRTLALTRGTRGKTVECSVTARNQLGSATATSRPYEVR